MQSCTRSFLLSPNPARSGCRTHKRQHRQPKLLPLPLFLTSHASSSPPPSVTDPCPIPIRKAGLHPHTICPHPPKPHAMAPLTTRLLATQLATQHASPPTHPPVCTLLRCHSAAQHYLSGFHSAPYPCLLCFALHRSTCLVVRPTLSCPVGAIWGCAHAPTATGACTCNLHRALGLLTLLLTRFRFDSDIPFIPLPVSFRHRNPLQNETWEASTV